MGWTPQHIKEAGFSSGDAEKMASFLWPILEQKTGVCGVIGEPGGELEGYVILSITEMWYSTEKFYQECGLFVSPNCRSSSARRAIELIRFAKKKSDEAGMRLLVGIISDNRTDAKIRLYEREFGKKCGAYFVYGAGD